MKTYLFLLLFFPFAGGLIQAVIGRYLPRRVAEWIACAGVLGSLLMAILAFGAAGEKRYLLTLFDWIQVGDFSASMTVYYDALAAIMALMVTFVSSLIHLYSVSFMRDDRDYVRYFCYMNLFVFSMLVITLADNLVFLYRNSFYFLSGLNQQYFLFPTSEFYLSTRFDWFHYLSHEKL